MNTGVLSMSRIVQKNSFLFFFRVVLSSLHGAFSTTLSLHCSQRDGGLAQRRLPLNVMRGTNFQFRTAFHAGFLPPLRQTAR
jgi:hypothetical protein